MEYFPAFMNLKGRGATVIGGGAVAARKIAMLRRAGAPVSVIAPRLHASLARDEDAGRIEHRARAFEPEHLDGSVIIIAATDNRDLNRQVARHARLRAIPVNVVDDPELSSFIMPAVIDRSPVMVAVSTGGASPVLARWTRARIEAALPTALGRLGALAGRAQPERAACAPQVGFAHQVLQAAGPEDHTGGGTGIGKTVVGRQGHGRIRCAED